MDRWVDGLRIEGGARPGIQQKKTEGTKGTAKRDPADGRRPQMGRASAGVERKKTERDTQKRNPTDEGRPQMGNPPEKRPQAVVAQFESRS